MKVAARLAQRRQIWAELDEQCARMETRLRDLSLAEISEFGRRYRAACADLALADAYELPPNTVQYLHRLVARAHNQLYRSRRFQLEKWGEMLLVEVPKQIFRDPCVRICFCIFWGIFFSAAALASNPEVWPGFAERMLPESMIQRMEEDFAQPMGNRPASTNPIMASFYIRHNTSIGLQCFVGGLLVVVGLLITIFNAAHLGAVFGYMARPEVAASDNFFEFVTAHGPFELTAIVLSAAAGLRLGISWIHTNGLTRAASLRKTATEAMPLMGAAMVMFFLAALIEGFLSPSGLPYAVKACVALASSGFLTAYFVLLGFPSAADGSLPTGQEGTHQREA
ncbi:MAG: stage II sporulation protein M [Planctomycetota bacterium]